MDILAACDEHCLPEDEIKDYDILLQYDDYPDSTPGLQDSKRESCAFACKIVDMNQTKGLSDILGGQFTIMSVEELPNGNGVETSEGSSFSRLTAMVGLQKNVTFSPSIIENVTINSELLNQTSNCCTNSGKHSTNETPTSTPIEINDTKSDITNKNTSSVFGKDTPAQKQQFSVVPVIPKVIRFTNVEVEMAEAGVNTTPSAEEKQAKSSFDVNNNASLILQSLIKHLTLQDEKSSKGILEMLGLRNLSQENNTPLVNETLKSYSLPNKVNSITEEAALSQPSQERKVGNIGSSTTRYMVTHPMRDDSETTETNLKLSRMNTEDNILETLISLNQTKSQPKLVKENKNCSSSNKTDANCNSFENSGPEMNVPNVLNNSSASPFIKGNNATKKEYPSSQNNTTHLINYAQSDDDIGEGTREYTTKKEYSSQDNMTLLINETQPKDNIGKVTGYHTNKPEYSSSQDNITTLITETQSEDDISKATGEHTTKTEYLLTQKNITHSINETQYEDDIGKVTVGHTTKSEYLSSQNNITDSINETQSEDDIRGKLTGDKQKLPVFLEKSVNLSKVLGDMTKNEPNVSLSDSKDSLLTNKDLNRLSPADLTSPNNYTSFHNESFSLDNLEWPNITDNIYEELFNTSNLSSTLSQNLEEEFPSTQLSNVADFSIHNNMTFGNSSYTPQNLYHEANTTEAILNKTTSVHRIM